MNIFGIPILIPYAVYLEQISQIPIEVTQLTPSALFIGYILLNIAYMYFVVKFMQLFVKIAMFIFNKITYRKKIRLWR